MVYPCGDDALHITIAMGVSQYLRVDCGKSPAAERVEREVAAIERVAKRASASPEAAQAFLQSAGIVDSKGNLVKKYR